VRPFESPKASRARPLEDSYFEPTGAPIRAFARVRVEALARKAIYRLRRMPASGIYGDAWRFKTVWDEFCHEIQTGPREQLDWAWQDTIGTITDDLVGRLSGEEGALLTIAAMWEYDEAPVDRDLNFTPDLVARLVSDEVNARASSRDIGRFTLR